MELMVVLVLLAIMAAIALPNFTSLIRDNRLQAKADELHDLLQYARGEAVTNRIPVQLTIDSTAWLVRAGDSERSMQHTAQGVQAKSSATGTSILYRPNGTANPAKFTICRESDPASGFLIEIRASGVTHLYPRGKQNTTGTSLTSCTP